MEVHSHTHSPRKKWAHYFWEFLMLFLAVFCGFLAEYQLEHKIEIDREKIYIKNMYEDLKTDTVIYSTYDKNISDLQKKIDSLLSLMKSPERDEYLNEICFLARTITMVSTVVFPNNRTFDEMKQGGQLRLIRNQKVADKISHYYNSLHIVAAQNGFIYDRSGDLMGEFGKMFDANILLKIYKENRQPVSDKIKLLTNDPLVINLVLSKAQYVYGSVTFQKNLVLERAIMAKDLINVIKKEYHLQ